MMKKRQFLLTMMMIGTMALAAGCSSKNTAESAPQAQTEESAEAADEGTADTEEKDMGTASDQEQSTLTGVLDEVKDFMFVVVDKDDNPYAFSFGDEKPKGLDEVKVGEQVVVTYTGEISVVDAFTGEVISVEKAE